MILILWNNTTIKYIENENTANWAYGNITNANMEVINYVNPEELLQKSITVGLIRLQYDKIKYSTYFML